MKRGIIINFLFIFLISLATATPMLIFQHNETQPGETIFATITAVGEFTSGISSSDIKFFEDRKEVFFESDITFYNGTYYIYAYTTREGNFTLKMSNILYEESDELQSITIEKAITIKNNILFDGATNETRTEILSIKPGFVRATDKPKLKLINQGTSTLNFTYLENETSLQPLESIELEIQQEELFSNLKLLTYKEFLVPVIRPPNDIIINDTITIQVKHDLRPKPGLLQLNLTEGESSAIIELFNFGDTNITNMQFTSNISFMEIEEIENLEAKGVHNLSLVFSPESSGHVQGYMNITYTQDGEEKTLSIPLDLFILPVGSTEEDFQISNETCEGEGGKVCAPGEICDKEQRFTKDKKYCCLGTCVPKKPDKKGSGFGWLIGLIILAALGAGGYYFYKKQKKIVPKKHKEQLKESSERYSKRLSGALQRS